MSSAGYRVAQLGGALMILGGVLDLSIRGLLPHHLAVLSAGTGAVSDEASRLVLAMLHALGGALIAAGIAVLALLHYGRKHRDRRLFVLAACVAVLAEGPNAWGMLSTGSSLYVAPILFMILVVIGSTACLLHRRDEPPGTAVPAGAAIHQASSAE